MRLWSIHPRYLDRIGIVALWREALLAQKVLAGETKGYVNHPQLSRFKRHNDPLRAVGDFLAAIWDEAESRGYNFNRTKIRANGSGKKIALNRGQLEYEFGLLLARLKRRDPGKYRALFHVEKEAIECHPIFEVVEGGIEGWERIRST